MKRTVGSHGKKQKQIKRWHHTGRTIFVMFKVVNKPFSYILL